MGIKDTLGDHLYENTVRPARARSSDPSTSHAAARAIAPRLNEIQEAVLDAHKAHTEGLCDYDLQELLGDHGSTYRTRRAELVEMRLLKDSGRKVARDGRKRIIWIIA